MLDKQNHPYFQVEKNDIFINTQNAYNELSNEQLDQEIILEDNYIFKQKQLISSGNYGELYIGTDKYTNQSVAIKKIYNDRFSNKFMRNSIVSEINLLKSIQDNVNINKFLDCVKLEDNIYIITEYNQEGNLKDYIKQQGGFLQEKQAQNILKQIINAFNFFNKHGFIVRNFTPENILKNYNTFKLTDFSLCTKTDIEYQYYLQNQIGNEIFLAPQILENLPYTNKCDIWSIGSIYYYMLFGKTPFQSRDSKTYIQNVKDQFNLQLNHHKNQISQESKNFLINTLQYDENHRLTFESLQYHTIFTKTFNELKQEQKVQFEIENKQLNTLNQIQTSSLSKNYKQILEKFQQIDNENKFYELCSQLDSQILKLDSNLIYQIFQKDGKVDTNDFKQFLENYSFYHKDYQAKQIISEIQKIIVLFTLPIQEIFKKFQLEDKKKQVEYNEFKIFLNEIVPNINQKDVQELFRFLSVQIEIQSEEKQEEQTEEPKQEEEKQPQPQEGEQYQQAQPEKQFIQVIIVENLQAQFSQGIQIGQILISNAYLKSTKILEEIAHQVKQQQLNIEQEFNNFELDKNKQLNLGELTRLCKQFIKEIDQNDVISLIQAYDYDNSQKISMSEFQQNIKSFIQV